MSYFPHTLSMYNTAFVDFTSAAEVAFPGSSDMQMEVVPGFFAMYPGDVDGDGAVLANDELLWHSEFQNPQWDGYHNEDIDLDGSVLVEDCSIWKRFFSAAIPDSGVPFEGELSGAAQTPDRSKQSEHVNRKLNKDRINR